MARWLHLGSFYPGCYAITVSTKAALHFPYFPIFYCVVALCVDGASLARHKDNCHRTFGEHWMSAALSTGRDNGLCTANLYRRG